MSSARLPVCSQCGAELRALPGGARVCAACLLRGGLRSSESFPGESVPMPDDRATLPGAFGDYEDVVLIGRGGMGLVYRARQRSLNRTVALKALSAAGLASPVSVDRFRMEAEAVARLQHPNIVAIHEVGLHDGRPFFSMDYVEGVDLRAAGMEREGEARDYRRLARWLRTAAEAVHYAHRQGIVHRDLKPSNILIDGLDQPRITDFGLAKHLGMSSELTQSGQVLGSPSYMPPEQAEPRRGPIGPSSDVYSLGAVLYQLLTGRPPFQGETLTQVLQQVLESDPVRPRTLNRGVPVDLESICLKCLEKDPPRRYRTALDLAEDLGRYLVGVPIRARPAGVAGRTWRWCRRRPATALLLGSLGLSLWVGTIAFLTQWDRARAGEALALRHAYAGDMSLAQHSLEEGDLRRAREILGAYDREAPRSNRARPVPHRLDLRGWEWRYLWGLASQDDGSVFARRTNRFLYLALSPDGNWVALRRADRQVELWNRGSGRRAGELPAKSWHLAMAFVPRRNLLAVADGWTNAPVLNLWNPETLELVRSIPQASAIAALAFSPSGDLGASFHLDPKVRLWSPSSGELLREIPASEAVNSSGRVPLFSPDGRLLALGEMDGGIRLLDVADGRIRELPTTRAGNAVSALAFSPDGRFLACGYAFSDSSIQLWDIRAGTLKATFEGHRGWVGHLCFGSEGKTLYSGSADSTIRIWDSDTRQPIGVLQGHTDGISGLALVPDESALVSCGLDGTARLWAPAAGRRRGSHSTLPIPVGAYSAPFTADSRRFITVSPEHPTIIWDTASATELERIPALGTNNFSVDISPDERLLAVGALDGRVKIWNLADRRLVRTFRPQSIPIFRVSFWEGGRRLLTHAVVPQQQIRVQLWDTSSGAEIPFRGIDVGAAMDLARSADGRLLAVPSDQGVALYDYRAERLLANLMRTPARATAFTEDGKYVGAASDRSTKVWEMASLREVANLSLHANSFVSLAFSPDGRRLVTTGSVGKRLQPGIYVWDYLIGRELLTLPSEGEFGALIRFSPDGNALLRISWSGIVDLYRAPSWSEIRARSKATGSRETRSESRARESGATEEGASKGGAGSTGSRAAGHVPG